MYFLPLPPFSFFSPQNVLRLCWTLESRQAAVRFLGVQLCPKVQSKVPNTGFVRKSVHKVLFNPRMGGREGYRPAEGCWVGQMCEFRVRKLWSRQSETNKHSLYTVKNKQTREKRNSGVVTGSQSHVDWRTLRQTDRQLPPTRRQRLQLATISFCLRLRCYKNMSEAFGLGDVCTFNDRNNRKLLNLSRRGGRGNRKFTAVEKKNPQEKRAETRWQDRKYKERCN